MAPTLQSPNTGNYVVGKGVLAFKPDGATNYHYLGNVPEMEFEPSLETLDHFSSMEGVRSKDVTEVLEKGGSIRLVMEELTARNLALFLLTDPDLTNPNRPVLEIFESNLKSGALKYIGTNDIGPRWVFDFARVNFVPSGSFNPISEEWANLEVTGELATVNGSFGTATLVNIPQDQAPENLGLPEVVGVLDVGYQLSAYPGVWTGGPTYTYKWLADDVEIPGATSSTYTLTESEAGKAISVEVTATNDNGAVSATSPATADVTDTLT